MNRQVECLRAADLEQLLLQPLADQQAEAIAQHLETCPSCSRAAEALLQGDAMAEAMRQGSQSSSSTPGADVHALIARLKGLIPEAPTLSTGLSVTAPQEPTIGTHASADAEAWDFLAPPQQPDE